jgi:hypothetical protein
MDNTDKTDLSSIIQKSLLQTEQDSPGHFLQSRKSSVPIRSTRFIRVLKNILSFINDKKEINRCHTICPM